MSKSTDFLNHNINRLMRDKSEWITNLMKARMADNKTSEFTPAEGNIFETLRGRRLTISEIARLRGVSRQSIHRTVSGLVERGYLCLESAESNHRDKIVVITPLGQRQREIVGEHLRALEDEIAAVIGKERLETLREILMEDWSGKVDP
jgi:DNA-binding MarR family transcriptional regulator